MVGFFRSSFFASTAKLFVRLFTVVFPYCGIRPSEVHCVYEICVLKAHLKKPAAPIATNINKSKYNYDEKAMPRNANKIE